MIETTDIGRIVIPPNVPEGYALFYTTTDFEGHLKNDGAAKLQRVVRESFGIEATLATCTQVHGASVVRGIEGECDSCDALFSDEPRRALAIKVADCLPVTLIDPAHGVIANIHSGWRGSVQRITSAALDALACETTFDPSTAKAWLGPSIRVCCFEVGEEVVDQFRATYANAAAFIDRTLGLKAHIDTVGLTKELLVARGVNNVVDQGSCTRCNGGAVRPGGEEPRDLPLFHSFRREPKRGGRNLAVVARQQ